MHSGHGVSVGLSLSLGVGVGVGVGGWEQLLSQFLVQPV